jgi:hypothetical protein
MVNSCSYYDIKKIREKNILPQLHILDQKIYSFWSDWLHVHSLLRERQWNKILKIKTFNSKIIEDPFLSEIIEKFESKINNKDISDIFHSTELIQNSRLNVKDWDKISKFFNKISMFCHSEILKIVNSLEWDAKEFFTVAFTANIANCSKLVPPITSRWDFSPWAWMTWFYIANQYIENNVFNWYINRVEKLLQWKKYIQNFISTKKLGKNIKDVINNDCDIYFWVGDVKNMNIPDNTIDIVVTDPPYESAVPYLEQSIIRNSFRQDTIDYENEIIISNSKKRLKNKGVFDNELKKSFQEICRVLKEDWTLIFTYNSSEETDIENLKNILSETWFIVNDIKLITQKTLSPRQLNRKNWTKWDLLFSCSKENTKKESIIMETHLIENINPFNYIKKKNEFAKNQTSLREM